MENENLTKVGWGFNCTLSLTLYDKPVRFFCLYVAVLPIVSFSFSFFLVAMIANLHQITQSKRSKRHPHNIS